ncbi:MAG: bacillithiol biosynthesis deacetylase BshB1 [Candidatus Eremiobacteraeota bacterium]|nr:bacillithiol biosynthesis deacetylase BshB1 [Candidatus Eremiobacteraeota bacterium]
MAYDVVAIAAHPDDAEIICGGTLVKMVKKGYQVAIVDLTRGERGTRGTPEVRADESEEARRVMGVHHRENLAITDTEIMPTIEERNRLIAVIRRLRPRLVIAPYFEGRHPDHVQASRLVYDACFFSGLRNYPLPGEPARPHKILYALRHKEFVEPRLVIDITGEFQTKLAALRCHRSQFPAPEGTPPHGIYERVTTFAAFCGGLIGKKYAEAFYTREAVEVDDPLTLTVPSM